MSPLHGSDGHDDVVGVEAGEALGGEGVLVSEGDFVFGVCGDGLEEEGCADVKGLEGSFGFAGEGLDDGADVEPDGFDLGGGS